MNRKQCIGGLAALTTTLAATGIAHAAKICWEAEKPASMSKPFRRASGQSKPYSGTGYIEVPWDQNKTKGIGQATYKFNVKTAGVYSVWARAFWANGCGNSIGVKVNNGAMATLGEDGTYDAWHWVGGKVRVRLNAGMNTLVLKNTETGPRVDQFYLTTDPDYVPTGPRKVTS